MTNELLSSKQLATQTIEDCSPLNVLLKIKDSVTDDNIKERPPLDCLGSIKLDTCCL